MTAWNFLFVILVSFFQVSNGHGESVQLNGRFQDGKKGKVDVMIDNSTMMIVFHKPDDFEQFHATSNLHIFANHLVAIKDDETKMCLIKIFNETHDEMEQQIDEAKQHNFNIGALKRVWIDTDNLGDFGPESVRLLFGPEIANFCVPYKVVFVDQKHIKLVDPEETQRVRRAAARFISSGSGVPSDYFQRRRFPSRRFPRRRFPSRKIVPGFQPPPGCFGPTPTNPYGPPGGIGIVC